MATRQIAEGLASLGRNGDTMLMHVQPQEVAGLQALANANGTTLTINPDTGLPEAFNLGGAFSSFIPFLIGAGTGGASLPLWAGVTAGAAAGAVANKENRLLGAALGGFSGFTGHGLGTAFGSMGGADPGSIAKANPTGAAMADSINTGVGINPASYGAGDFAVGATGVSPEVQQVGNLWGVNQDPLAMQSIGESFKTAVGNAGDVITNQPGAWESFKSAPTWGETPLTNTQAAMKVGMPFITAGLQGLEPSDLGYGGIDMAEAGKAQRYDPNARLYLGGASSRGGSGLQLLAASGGEIKSYAEGGLTEDGSRTLGAQELGLAQMMPVGIASLPQAQAGAPEIETKLPANQPSQVNIDIMQMKEPQAGLMQQAEQGAPIPELMQQQGGQGLNYQNMFGASQATRGYGPGGQMLASGGPVSFAAGGPAAPEASAPAMGTFATRAQEQRIQAAHDESVRAAQAASRNVQNSYGIPFFQNNAKSAGRPGQQNVMGFWVDPPGYQAPQSPRFTTRSQAIAGGRGTNFGGRNTRVFAGRGMRLAAGGNIGTGGIADLYGASDAQIGPPLSEGGYGLSRLSNLASEQAQNRAGAGSFSQGGVPTLEDGGFVIPADVVFYAGGHSTMEGQKKLAQKYGGVPIKGPGNGLSDDIPTSIEGKQPARVANGEVYIPKRNVQASGGPKKFYDMMEKVRKQAHGSKKQAKAAKV